MGDNEISVRRGLPTDAGAIARLYAQLVNNPSISVLPERIVQLASDPNTALFVAECDGHLSGTALVFLCADVMFGSQPFAVVENFVVDVESRGQSIGAVLMHAAESFSRTSECSKIMLLSASQRSRAHQFFERMGFAGDRKRGFVKYRRDFGVE